MANKKTSTKQAPPQGTDLRSACLAAASEYVGTSCRMRPGKGGELHVEVRGPKGRTFQGFVSPESLNSYKKALGSQFELKPQR